MPRQTHLLTLCPYFPQIYNTVEFICHSHMHCFPGIPVRFLQSWEITHINSVLLSFSHVRHSEFQTLTCSVQYFWNDCFWEKSSESNNMMFLECTWTTCVNRVWNKINSVLGMHLTILMITITVISVHAECCHTSVKCGMFLEWLRSGWGILHSMIVCQRNHYHQKSSLATEWKIPERG